jgi:hypothetical protein
MFHEVFHFVLVNGVRLASAILPAAPLLGQRLSGAGYARSELWPDVRRKADGCGAENQAHMVMLEEPAKVAAVIDQAAKEALAKPNRRAGNRV